MNEMKLKVKTVMHSLNASFKAFLEYEDRAAT